MMPWRIAGWGEKIWPMLLTSYGPISLGIDFDLNRLNLDFWCFSGNYSGMPYTLLAPFSECVVGRAHF